jgi:PRC-barrel domain protein
MARRENEAALKSLRDLRDLEVADHEPDPRGWQVVSADGRNVGRVDDLIVDTVAMRVRYLDCDLDESSLNLTGRDRDRHILVPIESATLNRADRQVSIQGINASDVLSLPPFERGVLTGVLASEVNDAFRNRRALGRTAPEAGKRGAARPQFDTGRDLDVDAGMRKDRNEVDRQVRKAADITRDDSETLRKRAREGADKVRETGRKEADKLRETGREEADKLREGRREGADKLREGADKLRERGREGVDKVRERGGEEIDKLRDRNKRDLP